MIVDRYRARMVQTKYKSRVAGQPAWDWMLDLAESVVVVVVAAAITRLPERLLEVLKQTLDCWYLK